MSNPIYLLSMVAKSTATSHRDACFALANAVLEDANKGLSKKLSEDSNCYITPSCVEIDKNGACFTITKVFLDEEALTSTEWDEELEKAVRYTEERVLVNIPSLEVIKMVDAGLNLMDPARAYRSMD